MLSDQTLFGAREAIDRCGAIPAAVPQSIRAQLSESEQKGERVIGDLASIDEQIPERWRAQVVALKEGASALPEAAIGYLVRELSLSASPTTLQFDVEKLIGTVDRFAVGLIASLASTLDRRTAIQMRKTIPASLAEAWDVPFDISSDVQKLVRDAYIHLSAEPDTIRAVGWYLTVFALRDYPTTFWRLFDRYPDEKQWVDRFYVTVQKSSRSECAPALLARLEEIIDGE